MTEHSVVSRDIDVMGGMPVFRGTRVPVQTLIDCLEGFPSVDRAQVYAFLEMTRDLIVAAAV